eukprot:6869823-Alexandrium_andersonii.AAC.1
MDARASETRGARGCPARHTRERKAVGETGRRLLLRFIAAEIPHNDPPCQSRRSASPTRATDNT